MIAETKKKLHPWRKVQTQWAFPAWAQKNPEERKRIEERFRKENIK